MAKRMRNDPAKASEGGGIDLTPMIDVTFQLIIFFICVTDPANALKAKLQLPLALKAERDKVEPGRLMINVARDGKVLIDGTERSDAQLREIFRYEANISPKVDGFPDKAVYIRADKYADYRHIEHVMALAQEFYLWRVMFNTADPNAAPPVEAPAET